MSKEKSNEIVVLTDVSMITTVVQRGMGDEIVKAASEAGARGATISTAVAPACVTAWASWV